MTWDRISCFPAVARPLLHSDNKHDNNNKNSNTHKQGKPRNTYRAQLLCFPTHFPLPFSSLLFSTHSPPYHVLHYTLTIAPASPCSPRKSRTVYLAADFSYLLLTMSFLPGALKLVLSNINAQLLLSSKRRRRRRRKIHPPPQKKQVRKKRPTTKNYKDFVSTVLQRPEHRSEKATNKDQANKPK